MSSHTLHHGDCLAVLRSMEADSVDAIVTDPPAGIAFMGKEWDKDKGGRDAWVKWMTEVARECLRVIKPGGHALVWAIPRTSHWTGWAWEDAGWEPRDKIVHLFGSGFPKSLSVSKAIDKAAGAEREVVGVADLIGSYDGSVRKSVGHSNEYGTITNKGAVEVTAPATDAAKQWDGWGTALKPAAEDWWLFRKPLVGTVAENVVRHGTGALNIDGCRIEAKGESFGDLPSRPWANKDGLSYAQIGHDYRNGLNAEAVEKLRSLGRWPANVALGCACEGDSHGADCVVSELDRQSPISGTPKSYSEQVRPSDEGGMFNLGVRRGGGQKGDVGGASRFFYTAKASRSERDEGVVGTPAKQMDESRDPDAPGANNPRNRGGRVASNFHPTVKPIELMRWLARLVTQPNGTVLDPFMGSGSTGCAAMYEGFNFIGIEQSDEYLEIARQRIEYHSLRARGGVVSPWENSAPAPAEKPEAKTDPGSLEDLFGFGE